MLINLGVLHSRTGRPREAEDAWRRTLERYRDFAHADPLTWRQDEARTVQNPGTWLFSHALRSAESDELKRETTNWSIRHGRNRCRFEAYSDG